MKELVLGLGAVCAACAMAATEITFTGADASNPTNLASAANWSAAPGADTIGVIDSSRAAGFVVNANLELAGLKITGTTATTIGGTATLTLGASGILRTGAGKLTLRCPMATSAAQTWDIADGSDFTTASTISGTADLVIANFKQYVHHSATVNYGGKITYRKSGTAMENKWVAYTGTGKWAEYVHVATAIPIHVRPPAKTTVNWRDIFPNGKPTVGSQSANVVLAAQNGGSNKVVLKDGDAIEYTSGTAPFNLQVTGSFNQQGGTVAKNDGYFLTLGYNGQDDNWLTNYNDGRAIYDMDGGTVKVSSLMIGYNLKQDSGDNVRFTQTGGKVSLPYSSSYGGYLRIGGGNSSHATVAEYRMQGGTLELGGYGGSYNLGLASPIINNTTMPAAGFIQTGGTVTSYNMIIGSDSTYWNEKLSKITNGYGLLDLSGGTLSFTRYYDNTSKPDDWVRVATAWNVDSAASNCVYSVKLHGGQVNVTGEGQSVWPLLTQFPKTETGTVFGTGDRNLTFSAPIYGTGVIDKRGAGALVLNDATRFTGTVDVKAGTVEVDGGIPEDIDADKCFRWLASSVSGVADGDRVTEWRDENFGLVASTNKNPYKKGQAAYPAPKFMATGVKNQPALYFENMTALSVATEENPIYGLNKCTVVAVIRPNVASSSTSGRYAQPVLSVMPGSSLAYMNVAGMGASGKDEWRLGFGRRWRGDDATVPSADRETSFVTRSGMRLHDGDVHAIAATIDGNKVTLTADGDTTNGIWTAANDVAPFGYGNMGWRGDSENYGRLYIGGHTVDHVDSASYRGYLLELRVYTNRLFTAAEQRQITKKLVADYDSSPARMAKYAAFPRTTGTAGGFTSWSAPQPAEAAASWDADTLDLEDGATVTSWASEDGQNVAGTADTGAAGTPTLMKDAINGHAALRFTGSLKQALAIPAAASPISGKASYTAAVVWRTESAGGSSTSAGILSSYVAAGTDDFSIYYYNRSAVSAEIRDRAGNTSAKTRKPYNLNDGEVHITILSCDGASKKYMLMTDGCFLTGTLANNTARANVPVQIGSYQRGATDAKYYFTGDIAAVKLYDKALTQAEMRDLGEHWAQKYATQLLVGYKYTTAHRRATGLAATNVMVSAGARLSMPLSDTAPFTMTRGTLSGAGEFLGTYRLQGAAALDASEVAPSVLDELNLAGGATVKVSKDAFGSLKVRRLVVSGANAVDITAGSTVPGRRETILTYDEAEIDPDATWTVVGGDKNMSVVHDPENKRLVLYTKFGMSIIVR